MYDKAVKKTNKQKNCSLADGEAGARPIVLVI